MNTTIDKRRPPQAPPTFNYTPENVQATVDDLLSSARATLDAIAALPTAARTFASVFDALAALDADMLRRGETLYFLRDAAPDAGVRAACQTASVALEAFKIEREMRRDVFEAAQDALSGADGLSPEDRRFAERVLLEGKRAGLNLPTDERAELANLRKDLAELCVQFRKNVSEEAGKVVFALDELEGVSQEDLSDFVKLENGMYEAGFRGPERDHVLATAKRSETRRKVWTAYQNRLSINVPVVDQMLDVRRKIAALLKYDLWADYATEIKMTKTGKAVVEFLDELEAKMRPLALRDLEELLAIKRQEDPDGDPEVLHTWDENYYNNLHAMRTLDLDGTIDMLSVEFVELGGDVEKGDIWHTDVLRYAVWEAGATSEDDFIGYAYLDLYHRDGKAPGASMWQLEAGYLHPDGAVRHRPVTAVLAGFAKSTADKPALLSHWDTVQFYHEMGHMFHGLLSKTKYARFHGTAVNVDFGETPSQMLENWCYVPEVLGRMTYHYETKEPIPADLVEKLIANRYRLNGLFILHQLSCSKFDVAVHTDKEPRDTTQLWHEICQKTRLIDQGETPLPGHAAFGHLVHYDVGYYSYAYSEVFSADMFHTVFANDPFDVEAGKRYRKEILLPGASRDEMESLVAFLGRPPNSEAFLKQRFAP